MAHQRSRLRWIALRLQMPSQARTRPHPERRPALVLDVCDHTGGGHARTRARPGRTARSASVAVASPQDSLANRSVIMTWIGVTSQITLDAEFDTWTPAVGVSATAELILAAKIVTAPRPSRGPAEPRRRRWYLLTGTRGSVTAGSFAAFGIAASRAASAVSWGALGADPQGASSRFTRRDPTGVGSTGSAVGRWRFHRH